MKNNKVIYKHQVLLKDEPTSLWWRTDAEIVYVGMQGESICIWESHDEGDIKDLELRRFSVHATGQASIPPDAVHVGSVQEGAFLVWHIYEVLSPNGRELASQAPGSKS